MSEKRDMKIAELSDLLNKMIARQKKVQKADIVSKGGKHVLELQLDNKSLERLRRVQELCQDLLN